MDLKCSWCNAKNKIRGMESSFEMPVICSECRTKIGYMNYKDLNELINERDYWKSEALQSPRCDGC